MNKRKSNSKYCTKIGMCLILSMGFLAFQINECTATVSPFTGATAAPAGGTIDNTTILTSYTTASGTVTSLSHAISAQGNFNAAGGGSGVDNVWGTAGAELDGVTAALNLDLSVGVINAGDTNATTTIDIGSTGTLFSQYFFSQEVTGGVAGAGNDFFLVELNGNDTIEIVPLDAGGNQIGAFSLSVASGSANWGGLGIGVDRIIESLPGNTGVSPLAGMAFDFEDFDDGLGGTLAGLHGIGISGTAGLDTMVVGVNGNLAPIASTDPMFHVNRITGEVSLENPGASDLAIRGYSITSTVGALDSNNWLPIAGNKDINGNGSIDANDAWTALSSPANNTDLSEFEFGGDGGVLGAGQTVVLSQGDGAWIPWFNEGDLQAEVMLADGNGTIVFVPVTYDGNGDTALLRSDFNHDGSITVEDWTILQTNSFTDLSSLSALEAYTKGDIDFDGDSDIFDYAKFVSDFDSANGAGSFELMVSSVPEPSSLLLFGVALAIGLVQKRKRFSVVGNNKIAAALSLAMICSTLSGVIATPSFAASPYTADANAVHLYHFDEAAGTTVSTNFGSAGNSVIAFDGNPNDNPAAVDTGILGAAGFAGFGNSADIYETDKGLGFDANGDTNLQREVASEDDFIDNASFVGANGAFTVEAMINLSGELVGDPNSEREIMSMDSTNGARSFYFRVSNVGGVGALRFRSISDGPAVDVPVPTAGAHAYAADTWFHVAFSYDGEGSGDFYWTRMDTGVTSANAVGTVDYADITSTTTGPLIFGNEGRGVSTTGLQGSLDEVRISDIARSPNAFVFSDPDAQFTAEVNELTGEIRLVNNTDSTISFSSYQLVNDTVAAFNAGNWNSLSNQSGSNPLVNPVDGDDPGSIAGDSAGESWGEAGGAGNSVLSEQFPLGSTSLAVGEAISLGTAYDLSAAESFSFNYFDATANRVYTGLVDFVTSTDNADFDNDGDVDGSDFLTWQTGFGSGSTQAEGDANGDGNINAADLAIWQAQLNNGSGGGSLASAAVPEPSSIALFLVAALATAFTRKKAG